MTTNNTTQKTELQQASTEMLTKVAAPMIIASAIQFGVIHLVGRKLFPTVFTSVGRTYGIMFLARFLTKGVKETPEMKKISAKFAELSKTAR